MGVVGCVRGEFAIGAAVVGRPKVGTWRDPMPGRKELWHDVSNSLVIPHKDLGPEKITVGGVLLRTSATADTFKNAVLETTAKKFSWHDGTVEKYIKVYNGRITSSERIVMKSTGTVYEEIGFEFTSYDTRLYKASDDSVLWGA